MVDSQTPESSEGMKVLPTTRSHQGLTLIGCTFVVFELVFLILLSNDFWFKQNVIYLGIPCVFILLPLTHLLLRLAESAIGCSLTSPIFHGKPPIFYKNWVTLDEPGLSPGFTVGVRHVAWSAVDSVELSFMGNLVFKTTKLAGVSSAGGTTGETKKLSWFERAKYGSDVITSIPFGQASNEHQKYFIHTLRSMQPNMVLNKRLEDKLKQVEVKGTALVMQLGVVFMFLVLSDVGYSTFSYLEVLKNFYLCQKEAKNGGKENLARAEKYYDRAVFILDHPFALSWVSKKLLKEGNIAADAMEIKSESLWALQRKEEALKALDEAARLKKENFRIELRMARYLAEMGRLTEADEAIKKAIKHHKHAFLPRLYSIVLNEDAAKREAAYDDSLKTLDDEIFEEEPTWPPSGKRYVADLYYRDDLHFVFDRMLKARQGKGSKTSTRQN